jgi:hypothetical protein
MMIEKKCSWEGALFLRCIIFIFNKVGNLNQKAPNLGAFLCPQLAVLQVQY